MALKLIQSYTELDHHNLILEHFMSPKEIEEISFEISSKEILEHFMSPVQPSSLPGSCISIPYSRQEVYIDDR